jgi:hypothetical protein
MRFPKWTVPALLRCLSLLGLSSASGTSGELRVGLSLSTPVDGANSISSQPRLEDLSLDLNFFVQVANQELKVPIMPLYVFSNIALYLGDLGEVLTRF